MSTERVRAIPYLLTLLLVVGKLLDDWREFRRLSLAWFRKEVGRG